MQIGEVEIDMGDVFKFGEGLPEVSATQMTINATEFARKSNKVPRLLDEMNPREIIATIIPRQSPDNSDETIISMGGVNKDEDSNMENTGENLVMEDSSHILEMLKKRIFVMQLALQL